MSGARRDVSVFTDIRRIYENGTGRTMAAALSYRPTEDPFAVWVIFDPGSNEPISGRSPGNCSPTA